MEVKDLCQVNGLGPSKAAKIIAALELSEFSFLNQKE